MGEMAEGDETLNGSEEAKAGETEDMSRPDDGPKGMPDWLRFPLVLVVVCAISALALAGVYSLTREDIDRSSRRKITGAFAKILGADYSEEKTEEIEPDGEGALLKLYVVRDAEGTVRAHAGLVKCPGSYNASEPIQLVVVLSADHERVLGVRVAKSTETPGLGERIKESPSALSIVGWIAGRPERRRVVTKDTGAVVGTVEEKGDGAVVFTDAEGRRREFEPGQVEVTQAPFPPAFLDQFTGIAVGLARLEGDGGKVDAITGATVSSRAVAAGVALAVRELGEAESE
jgi:Na+-translocating ferredoxin:NAD+ oxidoreductase RnfG subunit